MQGNLMLLIKRNIEKNAISDAYYIQQKQVDKLISDICWRTKSKEVKNGRTKKQ